MTQIHEHSRPPKRGWSLQLVLSMTRLSANMAVAAVITLVERLRGRHLHAKWSLLYETIVRGFRRSMTADLEMPQTARLLPPSYVPVVLRAKVRHRYGEIAGRPFESFTPRNWPDDGLVCLYLHGGAYVFGSPATHRMVVSQIAAVTGMRCIALDYRLAPEDPYPAAVKDADAALDALVADGVSLQRIWVAGDSAGGGLALSTMLRRRDSAKGLPRGAVLLSPWVDLTGSGASVVDNAPYDYLPAHLLTTYAGYYRGDESATLPGVSPLRADLKGLPPLLVVTGGVELLVSENRQLVAHATECGVDVQYLEAEAMIHVYPAIVPFAKESRDALFSIKSFIHAQMKSDKS